MTKLIGYVYDENGKYYHKYYFNAGIDNISNFIVKFSNNKVTLTDISDLLVMKVDAGTIFECCRPDDLEVIQKHILEKLSGKRKFEDMEFEETEPYVMELKKQ